MQDELTPDLPGKKAASSCKKLMSEHGPEVGQITLGFGCFLEKDLSNIQLPRRVERAVRYMSKPNIEKRDKTWIKITHSALVIYTDCKHPRKNRGNRFRVEVLVRKNEGLDFDEFDDANEKAADGRIDNKNDTKTDKPHKQEEPPFFDLSKSIRSMTDLFPDSSRLAGAEDESFTSRLTPIIQQMETLCIAPLQRPSVLYTLLPAKTADRNTCDKVDPHIDPCRTNGK